MEGRRSAREARSVAQGGASRRRTLERKRSWILTRIRKCIWASASLRSPPRSSIESGAVEDVAAALDFNLADTMGVLNIAMHAAMTSKPTYPAQGESASQKFIGIGCLSSPRASELFTRIGSSLDLSKKIGKFRADRLTKPSDLLALDGTGIDCNSGKISPPSARRRTARSVPGSTSPCSSMQPPGIPSPIATARSGINCMFSFYLSNRHLPHPSSGGACARRPLRAVKRPSSAEVSLPAKLRTVSGGQPPASTRPCRLSEAVPEGPPSA